MASDARVKAIFLAGDLIIFLYFLMFFIGIILAEEFFCEFIII